MKKGKGISAVSFHDSLLVQIIHKSCRKQVGIEHSSSFSLVRLRRASSEAFASLSQ